MSDVITPTRLIYEAAGHEYPTGDTPCWLCGDLFDKARGEPTATFVKPTFTDRDKAARPDSDTACPACVFNFEERSTQLAQLVGKADGQRMRNYSHIVTADGIWLPLTKAEECRRTIKQLIVGDNCGIFPPLVVIAESGQKHLIFRAMTNPVGATAGWVGFEEQRLWVEPYALAVILTDVEALYNYPPAKIGKGEIESGEYHFNNLKLVAGSGRLAWFEEIEARLAERRGSLLMKLAVFLATKEVEVGNRIEGAGEGTAVPTVAGLAPGVQDSVRPQHLGAIPGASPNSGIHIDSKPVLQLSLFGDVD